MSNATAELATTETTEYDPYAEDRSNHPDDYALIALIEPDAEDDMNRLLYELTDEHDTLQEEMEGAGYYLEEMTIDRDCLVELKQMMDEFEKAEDKYSSFMLSIELQSDDLASMYNKLVTHPQLASSECELMAQLKAVSESCGGDDLIDELAEWM